jgi:outer membrane protein TolC
MKRVIAVVLLSVGMLGSGQANAQRMVSFREALDATEAANPSLIRSQFEVEQAEASLMSARGTFDPTLSVNTTWQRNERVGFFQGFKYTSVSTYWDFGAGVSGSLPTGTTFSVNGAVDRNDSRYETEFEEGSPSESIADAFTSNTSVSLTQQILRGHRLSWNLHHVTRARDGLAIAALSQERTRQETLAEAARAYWYWTYQVRLVDIAEQNAAVAEEALRIGVLRLESGELAPVEKTRLEAALVQAQAALIDARIAAEQAADALLLLMGDRPDQEAMPSTSLGDVPPLELDVDAAVEVALAQNLDLAVARARLESARVEHAYARHGTLPTLSATASAGLGAQDDSLGAAVTGLGGEDAFPFFSVSGNLSVPIGNRAARGEARRTSGALHATEIEVAELEDSVRAQVEQQVRLLSQARRRVELVDINQRLAEETLSAEEALEQAGRSIQKDVLEARTEVHRARVEAAKARADYRLAQTELLRLQGQLDVALR